MLLLYICSIFATTAINKPITLSIIREMCYFHSVAKPEIQASIKTVMENMIQKLRLLQQENKETDNEKLSNFISEKDIRNDFCEKLFTGYISALEEQINSKDEAVTEAYKKYNEFTESAYKSAEASYKGIYEKMGEIIDEYFLRQSAFEEIIAAKKKEAEEKMQKEEELEDEENLKSIVNP
ncbi:hypothetical protein H312_00105 [Anncaliia algerae PRA339]|uniref:Uncharacterized protein n=1 Tax=Anncaliia algerae PRA339 TaxID=1288291 RepID=A0A059F5Q7_9MICR|nr:hypothetical protein H312_00105 [Anncaliia algerae PRA339]